MAAKGNVQHQGLRWFSRLQGILSPEAPGVFKLGNTGSGTVVCQRLSLSDHLANEMETCSLREAGNNVQYVWSYYSVAELKKTMDAFDAWEGKGVSYWWVPHELMECWTLGERPILGSLCHMAPMRKSRLTAFNEEEEDSVNALLPNSSKSTGNEIRDSGGAKSAASS